MSHLVACRMAFILFFDQDQEGRSAQAYEECLSLSIFSRLGPFGWFILELH